MPTDRSIIEKWSLTYHTLKFYVDFSFKFYFRTTYSGKEKIPWDKSLIFAPNHQNALMDALALLSLKVWQPVYLARADIFKKPLINKILTFLKILPIYRMRDGFASLQRNDEVFNKTMDVLKNKNGLVILPEGNHGDKKQLRLPLKKGIARIALQAEDASNGNLDIYIVPVGLDYKNYVKVGSKLHIRFGTPIRVKSFLKHYDNNPAKAYNMLLNHLQDGMRSEMIDIDDSQYYSAIKIILDTFTREYLTSLNLKQTHQNEVDAQIKILKKIKTFREKKPDSFLLLAADALEYRMLLNRRKIDPAIYPMTTIQKWYQIPKILLLIATLPLFVASFVNNIFPIGISNILSKKFTDKQFVSSVRYTVGLVLTPIFYLLQVAAIAIITKSLVFTLAYFAFCLLSMFITFEWKKVAVLTNERLREFFFNTFRARKMERVKELNKSINQQLKQIITFNEEEDYLGVQ
ncbi:MAG: 1-acyl-sn-glycerol-3-phosphate acyltransferase [Bacteroidales bacterium]